MRVSDASVTELLIASLLAKFAEYYTNLFDKSDLESFKHQVRTARRSQKGGSDRILKDSFTDLKNVPVAVDQLLKTIKLAIALPVSTASNESHSEV